MHIYGLQCIRSSQPNVYFHVEAYMLRIDSVNANHFFNIYLCVSQKSAEVNCNIKITLNFIFKCDQVI